MKLPSIEECNELFEEYKVPGTIREHCKAVHTVAIFLTQELIKNDYPLDIKVVEPFSYLHDFMKAVVLENLTDPFYNYHPTKEEVEMHQKLRFKYEGLSETFVTYLILKEKYPEFAKLFLELDQLTQNPQAQVREESKFIHYVDWRILSNKIVSLKERMDYIHQRYGDWMKKKKINWEKTKEEQYAYEQKLFKNLPFLPLQLSEKISI